MKTIIDVSFSEHYRLMTERFQPETVLRHEVRWMAACYARREAVQRVVYLVKVQPRRTR